MCQLENVKVLSIFIDTRAAHDLNAGRATLLDCDCSHQCSHTTGKYLMKVPSTAHFSRCRHADGFSRMAVQDLHCVCCTMQSEESLPIGKVIDSKIALAMPVRFMFKSDEDNI